MSLNGVQGQFRADDAWTALLALLAAQMPGVDVQAVTAKEVNDGTILMTPPSVRVFYAESRYESLSDAQRLSYDAVHRFVVLCADQDLSAVANQALASVALMENAKTVLAGTRLLLPAGEISEPLTVVSVDLQPVAGVGVAYCIGLEVPGLAQFPGANAGGV